MRVLLIEDEPTTAKAIEMMLLAEGFNVYTAVSGDEGLDLGMLYDYDVILLDLNLPDMHGYDVLKKLRVAKVPTPVLVLSGISEMDSKIHFIAANWSRVFTRLCDAPRGIRSPLSAPANCQLTSTAKRLKSMAAAYILRARNMRCLNC